MRLYHIPKWSRIFYPGAIWDFFSAQDKAIYLTFDDGPDPETTPWLLDTLDKFNAKATFFCLGENVKKHPDLFEKIRSKGHAIGNHGMYHFDGLKTSNDQYLQSVSDAASLIHSSLFRPAYGRIKKSQFKAVKQQGFKVVFWSLMTYDFDHTLSSEKRLQVIRAKTKPGSVLVFHDSKKAFPQLSSELPILLEEWMSKGFITRAIS